MGRGVIVLVALGVAACSSSDEGPSEGGSSSSGASSSGASSSASSSSSSSGASGASSSTSSSSSSASSSSGGAPGWTKAFNDKAPATSCGVVAEAKLKADGAPSVTFGAASIYVGYEQLGQNQNPIVVRFDGGAETYCVKHEVESPDGRALGITWDGGPVAYVVYTIVGGGSAFDAKAKGKWLDGYGDGGASSKVSYLGAVDAASGELQFGTFVIAKKADGKTNTHTPADAVTRLADGRLEFRGSSAFQPMNPDKSVMQCTAYPFDTRYVFSADLGTLTCSSSTNCTSMTPCP